MAPSSTSVTRIGESEDDKIAIRTLQQLGPSHPLQADLTHLDPMQKGDAANAAVREIRAVLPVIGPLISQIPKGAIIVAALETLMSIADLAGGAPPPPAGVQGKAEHGTRPSYVWVGASEADQQAIRTLEAIMVPDAVQTALGLPNLGQACRTYHTIAPVLTQILPSIRPLIAKLPKGDVIVSGLTTLMDVADTACVHTAVA